MPENIERKKILVSAYACHPDIGSEQGMGWNWVIRMARHHDVWLITEQGYVSAINEYLKDHPELDINLHITGVPRKRYGERIWSHIYYLSYRSWQWKAYKKALELDKVNKFDLVHQLNMIGYREPGYMWKLPAPFVWGPIGGHVQMPARYLGFLGVKGAAYYGLRNVLNWVQMRTSCRVRRAIGKARRLISATPDDQIAIKRIHKRNSALINEVGASPEIGQRILRRRLENKDLLRVVWCGRFLEGKALPIGLHAIRQASAQIPLELHILGSGRCEKGWKTLAEQLGVEKFCTWYGRQPHQRSLEVIGNSDVLLLTSLQDATSTVLLEAISCGVPVICHDTCGFGTIIDSSCGIKIPVRTPMQSIQEFSQALIAVGSNRELLAELKRGASRRALEVSWDNRVNSMLKIYEEALTEV